jgi:hypothetical protein
MADTEKIIEEALSLPVEQRAFIADCLLKSLNTPSPEIEKAWLEAARRRIAEIRSGEVTPVPGNEVFDKIKRRFAK